jgi:hypothetical protein
MKKVTHGPITYFAIISWLVIVACNKHAHPLYKLEGCWKYDSDHDIYESWRKVNDSLMLGKGFSVKGDDTTVNEEVQLWLTEKEVRYIAKVHGQNDDSPVIFLLRGTTRDEFCFENPQHDFPQKICYRFIHDTLMSVTIAGNNDQQRSSWLLSRKK